MSTATVTRTAPKNLVCGFCENAARNKDAEAAHRNCRVEWCACGAVNHKFDRSIAETMARASGLTVDQVYSAHGRKRRIMTDEQKAAGAARLAAWRAQQAAGIADTRTVGSCDECGRPVSFIDGAWHHDEPEVDLNAHTGDSLDAEHDIEMVP